MNASVIFVTSLNKLIALRPPSRLNDTAAVLWERGFEGAGDRLALSDMQTMCRGPGDTLLVSTRGRVHCVSSLDGAMRWSASLLDTGDLEDGGSDLIALLFVETLGILVVAAGHGLTLLNADSGKRICFRMENGDGSLPLGGIVHGPLLGSPNLYVLASATVGEDTILFAYNGHELSAFNLSASFRDNAPEKALEPVWKVDNHVRHCASVDASLCVISQSAGPVLALCSRGEITLYDPILGQKRASVMLGPHHHDPTDSMAVCTLGSSLFVRSRDTLAAFDCEGLMQTWLVKLPKKLSADFCSLIASWDRIVLSCGEVLGAFSTTTGANLWLQRAQFSGTPHQRGVSGMLTCLPFHEDLPSSAIVVGLNCVLVVDLRNGALRGSTSLGEVLKNGLQCAPCSRFFFQLPPKHYSFHKATAAVINWPVVSSVGLLPASRFSDTPNTSVRAAVHKLRRTKILHWSLVSVAFTFTLVGWIPLIPVSYEAKRLSLEWPHTTRSECGTAAAEVMEQINMFSSWLFRSSSVLLPSFLLVVRVVCS
jgi:hypothetical protein